MVHNSSVNDVSDQTYNIINTNRQAVTHEIGRIEKLESIS